MNNPVRRIAQLVVNVLIIAAVIGAVVWVMSAAFDTELGQQDLRGVCVSGYTAVVQSVGYSHNFSCVSELSIVTTRFAFPYHVRIIARTSPVLVVDQTGSYIVEDYADFTIPPGGAFNSLLRPAP